MTPAEHNPVFDQLVRASDDIEGFIAYGLYKQAKREWLVNHKTREGRAPTPAELRSFFRQWTPTTLKAFRENAESALFGYAQSVVQNETPFIQRDALVQGRPLWKDVLIGVVSALSYSVILVIAAFLLGVFGNDFLDALAAIKPR
jgi:hypothetical protein